MPISLILLVVLLILLVSALPARPYSSGWGYWPSGGAGPRFARDPYSVADGSRLTAPRRAMAALAGIRLASVASGRIGANPGGTVMIGALRSREG